MPDALLPLVLESGEPVVGPLVVSVASVDELLVSVDELVAVSVELDVDVPVVPVSVELGVVSCAVVVVVAVVARRSMRSGIPATSTPVNAANRAKPRISPAHF